MVKRTKKQKVRRRVEEEREPQVEEIELDGPVIEMMEGNWPPQLAGRKNQLIQLEIQAATRCFVSQVPVTINDVALSALIDRGPGITVCAMSLILSF